MNASRLRLLNKLVRVMLIRFMFLFCLAGIALAGFEIAPELIRKIQAQYGVAASDRIVQWQQEMQSTRALSDVEKLQSVNDFFNRRIEFVNDQSLWNVPDYWATPLEFLAKGAGDCEDYAIAKYFTLKELGIDEEKMRITYVKALELNQAHMVLTYFETPRSVPLVLDNLKPDILPASDRGDLMPVYSFNGSGLWLAKARGAGQRVGSSERLSLWQNLMERMNNNVMQ